MNGTLSSLSLVPVKYADIKHVRAVINVDPWSTMQRCSEMTPKTSHNFFSHEMLSVVASSALALNIGTSALTSARAAPSMAAALETKFVYERPAPIGTTSGPEYPNTVRASRLSSAATTVDGRMLETHLSTS